MILIASLGCRAGDVTRTRLYTGNEYIQYCHIHLKLNGNGAATWENLEACMTLEYAKGIKDVRNKELEYYFDPLNDPKHQHACPITLILVHALRHGLVRGTTIQEVLDHAAHAADRTVQWLFPDRPVVTAFTTRGEKSCQLDKPAGIDQVLQSTKMMGIVANIMTRVHPHALRLGAAKDIARLLPATSGWGFVTGEVRQALAHNAFQRGVTETYAGPPTRQVLQCASRPRICELMGTQIQ